MPLFNVFATGFILLIVVGCSSVQMPTVPVDGDMDGKSWTFCSGNLERVDVADGFVCKQFSHFYLEVESHYISPSNIWALVAKNFESEILDSIKKLRSEIYNVARYPAFHFSPISLDDNLANKLASRSRKQGSVRV